MKYEKCEMKDQKTCEKRKNMSQVQQRKWDENWL